MTQFGTYFAIIIIIHNFHPPSGTPTEGKIIIKPAALCWWAKNKIIIIRRCSSIVAKN